MKGIKTGLPWKSNAHTLDSNGLGALGASHNTAGDGTVGGADPLERYGQKASAVVFEATQGQPVETKKLLDQVDPRLYSQYQLETKRLAEMGAPASLAQRNGLATAFTQGLVKEFVRIGKKGKAPAPGLRKGQVPLGALVGFDAEVNNYQDLGGITSTLKGALSKLGGLACDVSTHPIAPIAAGAAGAYLGGPTSASLAMAGAGVAASACSSGSTGAGGGGYAAPASPGMPAWALPAILGGGAIALLLILKK
jgi:hypothetical protein